MVIRKLKFKLKLFIFEGTCAGVGRRARIRITKLIVLVIINTVMRKMDADELKKR
jgi:hypothetical protein